MKNDAQKVTINIRNEMRDHKMFTENFALNSIIGCIQGNVCISIVFICMRF